MTKEIKYIWFNSDNNETKVPTSHLIKLNSAAIKHINMMLSNYLATDTTRFSIGKVNYICMIGIKDIQLYDSPNKSLN